jgi:hypothetical protein
MAFLKHFLAFCLSPTLFFANSAYSPQDAFLMSPSDPLRACSSSIALGTTFLTQFEIFFFSFVL